MKDFDPRTKLIWVLASYILIFTSDNLLIQLILIASVFLLSHLIGVSLSQLFKPVKYMLFFLPVVFFIHVIFTEKVFADVSLFTIHHLVKPAMFTCRIAGFLILNSFLFYWVSPVGFLDSLYFCLNPLKKIKIPVDELFQSVFIAVRFFPVLRDEFRNIDRSWQNYMPKQSQSLRTKVIKARETLVPLMIFSFRKADRLAESMMMRGFRRHQERSYFSELHFRFIDGIGVVVGAMVIISIPLIKRGGWGF